MNNDTATLLQSNLEVAVPLHILRFKYYGHEFWSRWIEEKRPTVLDMLAAHGDDILFKSAKRGGTAAAFNALAEGLAALSFCPGGVRFLDLRWESDFTPLGT